MTIGSDIFLENKNILALDTSSSTCSVALLANNKVNVLHEVSSHQQEKYILSFIAQLLSFANCSFTQLDAVAFGCGPGSFTGVRIACSVAQALGLAASIPLISVSSLAILAQTAFQQKGWECVLVAVDAHIKEIYWAIYELDSNGVMRLQGREHLSQPSYVHIPKVGQYYAVGNGCAFLPLDQLSICDFDGSLLPCAKSLFPLAEWYREKGGVVLPAEAYPVYLTSECSDSKIMGIE